MGRYIGLFMVGLFTVIGISSIAWGEVSLADSYDFSPFFVGSANQQPEMPQASEMVIEGEELGDPSGWGTGELLPSRMR